MPVTDFAVPDHLPTKNPIQVPDQILKRPRVQELTSLPVSTLYAWVAQGRFPAPVRLGLRSVGWRRSDVQGWLDSRVSAREAVGA